MMLHHAPQLQKAPFLGIFLCLSSVVIFLHLLHLSILLLFYIHLPKARLCSGYFNHCHSLILCFFRIGTTSLIIKVEWEENKSEQMQHPACS